MSRRFICALSPAPWQRDEALMRQRMRAFFGIGIGVDAAEDDPDVVEDSLFTRRESRIRELE